MALKIVISFGFIVVFIIRIVRPDWNIDTNSIILLVLAAIPWLFEYIKALEISGIGKVELFDKKEKKEMERKAANAGIIINKTESIDIQNYSFYDLRYSDPKLALAGLRIEIESTLRNIGKKHNLSLSYIGINKMTDILGQNKLITENERAIIFDITGILNKAVHSQLTEYRSETFDWVFDLGINILKSLNAKL